jgi:hypothetical protein
VDGNESPPPSDDDAVDSGDDEEVDNSDDDQAVNAANDGELSDGGGPPESSGDDDDDGHESPSSDEDDIEQPRLVSELAQWHNECVVSLNSTTKLLKVLRRHAVDVPADARTLLSTPKGGAAVLNLAGGQYKYWGLAEGIRAILRKQPRFVAANDTIFLHCNMDGVRIFKSSTRHFWPILCQFNRFHPFIVALWVGRSKPTSLGDFVRDFLTELGELQHNGVLYEEKTFQLTVECFICDAVARSWLKCVIAYNGYWGCERCDLSGEWAMRRVAYNTDARGNARTDQVFAEMRYTRHQPDENRVSPFVTAGIGCVTQFVLDGMHLIFLGVAKRVLEWLDHRGDRRGDFAVRMSADVNRRLCNLLRHYSSQMPSDFCRRARGLEDLAYWKATEFRMFLLYLAPVVLRPPIVSQVLYDHFMRLTVAISLLLEPDDDIRNNHLPYARQLLEAFVGDCRHLYGPHFTVYNIHSLSHIADDVQRLNQSLNDISAFPFENHLRKIKKMVRSAHNPITQVYKRLVEVERAGGIRRMGHPKSIVRANVRDGCFLTKDNNYAFVQTVVEPGFFRCYILPRRFVQPLFNDPCASTHLKIGVAPNFRAKLEDYHHVMRRRDFHKKVVCFIDQEQPTTCILLPLLHDPDIEENVM